MAFISEGGRWHSFQSFGLEEVRLKSEQQGVKGPEGSLSKPYILFEPSLWLSQGWQEMRLAGHF